MLLNLRLDQSEGFAAMVIIPEREMDSREGISCSEL